MIEVRKGGCRCGRVRFWAAGEPQRVTGCCCRDCARVSGAPMIVWAGFDAERVRFTGTPKKLVKTTKGVVRGFCADCGTHVSYRREGEGALWLAGGCFDAPETVVPTEVVHWGERPAWFALADGIPVHEGARPEAALAGGA